MESFDPPFQEFYKKLFDNEVKIMYDINFLDVAEERELPLIDLSQLNIEQEEEKCKREIAKASQEWGFFQVINHGISSQVLEKMRYEQMKVFKRPFEDKANGHPDLNFSLYPQHNDETTCHEDF